MMMPNAAAGTIAMRLGAHGPGFSVASACATGSHAIGEALRMIQRGEADVVVAGGTEAALTGLVPGRLQAHGRALARGRLAPVRRPARRLRDGRGRGRRSCSSATSTPRARGATVYGADRRLRRVQRRVPHHPARRGRPRRGAGDARGAGRRGRSARRRRLPQRPRHQHAATTTRSRPARSSRCSTASARRRRSARRSRRSGTCSARPARSRRSPAWRRCAAACCRRRSTTPSPTPSATSTTCPRARARRRACELALSNSFGFGGQNACLAVAKA